MNDKKYIESKIRNSKALTYLNNEMLANRKALADALLQRAKDLHVLQALNTQVYGISLIIKELVTAVDLKHLDKPEKVTQMDKEECSCDKAEMKLLEEDTRDEWYEGIYRCNCGYIHIHRKEFDQHGLVTKETFNQDNDYVICDLCHSPMDQTDFPQHLTDHHMSSLFESFSGEQTYEISKKTWLRLSELREQIHDVDDAINFLLDGYHTAGAVDDAIEDVMTIFKDETKWEESIKTILGSDNHHSEVAPKVLNIQGVLRERLKQFLDVYHESDCEDSEPTMPDSPPIDLHERD